MFYDINKQVLIDEYAEGIKSNFFFARANSSQILSQMSELKPQTNSSSSMNTNKIQETKISISSGVTSQIQI